MLNHDLVPRGRVHFFFILILVKAFGIEMANELLMGFANHARQRLEITDIQTASCSFNENFIEKWLDGFSLCFFHIETSKVGKSCSDHVPCGDGFFRVQICGRGAKRVNAQG